MSVTQSTTILIEKVEVSEYGLTHPLTRINTLQVILEMSLSSQSLGLVLTTKSEQTSCRWLAATICPRRGLQRKPASAALSQAGWARPDQPIRAIQPAGHTRRPPTGCTRQTSDVRQHHRLMPPGLGITRDKREKKHKIKKTQSGLSK